MDPKPFLRGIAFDGNERVPYPRAKPDPRLPQDTWAQARIPVGVRLELVADAEAVEIDYRTTTEDLGYRGDAAGRAFTSWSDGERLDEQEAELGEGTVRLGASGGRTIVYLPEGMRPTILDVHAAGGGSIAPAPEQPRWIAYGDSVAEGWCASEPAMAWPAIAGRDLGFDVVNMAYAGAARGEVVSAEHIAQMRADVITVTHGTNCWTRAPHSVELFAAAVRAFLEVVREGHPETPIVVVSPVVRPDAETTQNRLGASLEDLRAAMEAVARDRIGSGDLHLELVPGRHLVHESQLADGIHPDDDGHRALADAIGPVLRKMVEGS
ncbi:MAG: SGNH/GDSL hydrolase family protein [Actinomycetota bacterium]